MVTKHNLLVETIVIDRRHTKLTRKFRLALRVYYIFVLHIFNKLN